MLRVFARMLKLNRNQKIGRETPSRASKRLDFAGRRPASHHHVFDAGQTVFIFAAIAFGFAVYALRERLPGAS